jgi:ribonuclease-3
VRTPAGPSSTSEPIAAGGVTGARTPDLHPLLGALGLDRVDPDLLLAALTHRSFTFENPGAADGERLELLGDAVVDLSVTHRLLDADPAADEGLVSRRRSAVVSGTSLAAAARDVGLGAHLRLGRGEAGSGGADKDSLLADAFEAVVGAVFASEGFATADALVGRLLAGALAEAITDARDPKTALQERAAARGDGPPTYRIARTGPDHAPTFTAEVAVADVSGRGTGGSRREAEQAAAREALGRLR